MSDEARARLARELFEAARHEQPSEDARSRALEALARMPAGSAVTSEHERGSSVPLEPRRVRRRALAYALVAAAAALVWVGARIHERRDPAVAIGPESHPERQASLPDLPTARSSVPSETPASEKSPNRIAPRHVSTPAARSPAEPRPVVEPPASRPRATLSEEVTTLDRARASLNAGDFATALQVLDDYDQILHGTRLSEEATLLRVEALQRGGRAEDATRLARAFVEKHPDSPLAVRARAFLDGKVSSDSKVDGGGLR